MNMVQTHEVFALVVVSFAALPNVACAQDPEGLVRGSVCGIVRGPLGEPVPNVEVVVREARGDRVVVTSVRTDGVGMFVVGGLKTPGTYQALSHAEGHTASSMQFHLEGDVLVASVELRGYEAQTLRGRVIDQDGDPVAGAFVLATKDKAHCVGGMLPAETVTDGEGRFVLDGVPLGDCVVRAWSPGFEMRQYWLAAEREEDIQVQLLRRAGVRLDITTEGLPAEIASSVDVQVHGAVEMPRVIARPTLGEDGAVSLTGLPVVNWYVRLRAPGYSFAPSSLRARGKGKEHHLHFEAVREHAFALRGVLRNAKGEPLAGQRLGCLVKGNGSRYFPFVSVTDAEGAFELQAPLRQGDGYMLRLLESDWVLVPHKGAGMSNAIDPRALRQWTGVADTKGELALTAAAAKVSVRVVDEDGRPAPFVRVSLQVEKVGWTPIWAGVDFVTASQAGLAVFRGVHVTGDLFRVHAEGVVGAGDSEPFELQAAAPKNLRVVCQRAGVVTGRVLDENGKPQAGVRVSIRNCDAETGRQTNGAWQTVLSDRQGRFAFNGVAPGGHSVMAGLHAGPKGQTKPFDVPAGQTVEVDLRLD